MEGAFSLNVIQAFPDFVAFFDTKGQRLSIYNLEDRKFYGFYPFSPTKKQIFFSKNYLGYLSGQYLKVANLSNLLERDNLHAINIYEHIIDSYIALGDWKMAYKFADQGLKKYQPQLSTFLISRAKSLFNLHEYHRVFRELPNLYNTFPVNTARRKQIEKFLNDIGLYGWHTNIQLRNGFRLLETSERFLIFCDHTSWRNSVLQIMQKKTGEIEKEIEVGRNFSGFLSKKNILTGFELLPEEEKGRFFRFDLNLGTHQELEFTPDIKISNPLMLPDYQTPNPLFVLFTGKKNSTKKLYEVDFIRHKIDTVAHFEQAIYATHWKKPVFYFCGKDTLFSLNLNNSQLNHQLIFLSKNGYYPLIKILYIDSNKLFGRTSRGNLIKINLNTGQPEVISHSIYFANEFGAFSRSQEVILWGKEGYKRFPYPSPNKMVDFIKKGNDLIALEPYRLVRIRNKKVVAEYPLIWKAIKFIVDGEKAYILSDSGILYSIDMKWNLKINENVKKGLILCLN